MVCLFDQPVEKHLFLLPFCFCPSLDLAKLFPRVKILKKQARQMQKWSMSKQILEDFCQSVLKRYWLHISHWVNPPLSSKDNSFSCTCGLRSLSMWHGLQTLREPVPSDLPQSYGFAVLCCSIYLFCKALFLLGIFTQNLDTFQ